MKRLLPYLACMAGLVAICATLPYFTPAQPRGIKLTRDQAKAIADVAARKYGIPVDKAWSALTWEGSTLLDKELNPHPELRRKAAEDPVIGPRLGGYKATYYRRGSDKWVPYGAVVVSERTGEVITVWLKARPEEPGTQPTEAMLRPRADAFVLSRTFPGAPSPEFEDARPTVQRSRTDWIFRYRVPSRFPTGNVVPYLYVRFIGDKFAGWQLIEEYADGSTFREDSGGEIGGAFAQFIVIFILLFAMLIVFLRKYHAGEVGVRAAALLFAAMIVLSLTIDFLIAPAASEGTGFGGLDQQTTSWAWIGFKFLFYDIPLSVLVFLAWAVGESYARERWGERLASFDAILRRHPFNATVGRSVLNGILTAPAVAGSAFLIALIPLLTGLAHPTLGESSQSILGFGGAFPAFLFSVIDAILYPVVAMLGMLAFASRRRILPLGIVAAIFMAVIGRMGEAPIDPYSMRVLFGFGAIGAAIAIFLTFDLLTAAIALGSGSMLICFLPLTVVARGDLATQLVPTIIIPALILTSFALAALMTNREVVYKYEDLAPHVRRIIERERVKAEIDAANRIQAALLPFEAPRLHGASVASHYRAATEIGGDYFDFLPQPDGSIGIAFGDVSGHGLTSGIVMAMAKAALLVQVDVDPSPRTVLSVLNEIVMKVAPKRMMMTFFFGVLDPQSQQLRFSSAGHLDPYVFRASPRRLEPLSSWGFPLGVRRREAFREHTVDFVAGDRLILYSDGLIEAVDDEGEPFGFERFEKTLLDHGHESADEIKKALLHSIRKFTRNRPPEDDQTLVVVSFEEAGAAILRVAPVTAYSDHVN